MLRTSYLLPAVAGIMVLVSALASAQSIPGDDGTLYFPPKLAVLASTDDLWMAWMFSGMPFGDSTMSARESSRVVFTRESDENTLQLLPMIFFDAGSYVIPERYQQFTGSTGADRYVDTADIRISEYRMGTDNQRPKYYEILNVIGYRMSQDRTITIELEGGYSTEPGEDEKLAYERSEVVKEYLATVWRIAPDQIAVRTPRRMCDSSGHAFRQEEARRVTVLTDHPGLFAPVRYRTSKIETKVVSVSLVIDPQMLPADVATIDIVIACGDAILSHTSVSASPDSTIYRLVGMWLLPRLIDDVEENLTFQAFVHAVDGRTRASNQVSVPVIVQDEDEPAGDLSEIYTSGGDGEDAGESYEEESYEDESYQSESGLSDGIGTFTGTPDLYQEIEGSFLFYESSDTSLWSFQRQQLDRFADSVARLFSARHGNRWTITVQGYGEPAENPELDNAQLVSAQAMYRGLSGYYMGLMTDPTFQVSIFFVRPTSLEEMERDPGALSQSLADTWFGDRADEIEDVQREWQEHSSTAAPSEQALLLLDTLLAARAAGLASRLVASIDTSQVERVRIHPYSTEAYVMSMFEYSPEARFYSRKVTVSVEPSDLYSNEWDEDDYEYIDEYEDEEGTDSEEFIEEEDEHEIDGEGIPDDGEEEMP